MIYNDKNYKIAIDNNPAFPLCFCQEEIIFKLAK